MSGDERLVRYHFRAEGRVQGVWFRQSTREQAEVLGVCGWVRNLPDGSVEGILEGLPGPTSRLLAWLRQGPEHALVARLSVEEEPPQGVQRFQVVG